MNLIAMMPYGKDFLFVDEILHVDESSIHGSYTFPADAAFYAHHFPQQPITPGVFLIESAAQIGLVAFGIYLLNSTIKLNFSIAFTSSQVDFFRPVGQGEKIFIEAEKQYFRFQKLKVSFKIKNSSEELVAKGELSGMFQIKN